MAIVKQRKASKPPAPKNITVTVHGLNHDAQGVARYNQRVLFVPNALPSETCIVSVTKQHRHFDEAKISAITEPSSERVEPSCPHYGHCGGCQLQHLASEHQLKYKQSNLDSQFKKHLKLDELPWDAPIESPAWNYRRRARLGVRYRNKLDEVIVGFREEANSHLTKVNTCPVLAPKLDKLIAPVAELIANLKAKSFITQVDMLQPSGQPCLVLRHIKPVSQPDQDALLEFADSHDVSVYLQGEGEPIQLGTPAVNQYDIQGLPLEFGVKNFIQGNDAVNQEMVRRVMDWLAPWSEGNVLDLFAGVGNFTLPLARHATSVTAVEGDQSMVDQLLHNAQRNGFGNVEAQAMNLADEACLDRLPDFDCVLLDPPRSGAALLMPWIARQKKPVVYVACDPSSLVRDAKVLLDAGYVMEKVTVMDMFPQTKHVESMALFVRRK